MFRCGDAAFVGALILVDRFLAGCRPGEGPRALTSLNVHRLFLASLVITVKYNEDINYPNSHYAVAGGIHVRELNRLELTLLTALDYNLRILPETYQVFEDALKGYGAKAQTVLGHPTPSSVPEQTSCVTRNESYSSSRSCKTHVKSAPSNALHATKRRSFSPAMGRSSGSFSLRRATTRVNKHLLAISELLRCETAKPPPAKSAWEADVEGSTWCIVGEDSERNSDVPPKPKKKTVKGMKSLSCGEERWSMWEEGAESDDSISTTESIITDAATDSSECADKTESENSFAQFEVWEEDL